MSVIIISLGAVIIGFILIFLLINRKTTPETPEAHYYSNINNQQINPLLIMPREDFIDLIKKLLIRLGFGINEIIATNSNCVDFSVYDPQPIKGGKFIVHCLCFQEDKLVNSTDIINLLDNVKGESALKGILITPHFFTVEALNAAAGVQLELINGERLVRLLRENDLM
ncbi:MAG: hypothetical protein A3C43_10235 [Candidatus Schekmanbacteria bacterium RIFCSPHIGHO2_02_FULL_38_11]|uniref:Restriction endonuclease type IV Mrr domain-containing protein n=1 Tax=Candidatus Schekmanbacteria bacterium RIFCSPLOWO2_12_FULL_38_15 TaxID=1817883 RepID=A0A1F7SPI2_9BACT|nr:MAG: hypothetical protein A3H37_08705 [Candidatus Schekmanbacteria bacterium RIFCSPLOWO2_02_FULL_38_14]OGL52258.1 MAG: hypothetical protein A3C43_10235 [Candidatus Schekmanbacteria bacterium RIFCSPHIGHO2_02_FULL_38_11]OGL55097.1 MAG: hypothetical protein A3G31_02530 [Candidatus Schekmanbacteria bacterium RIFCSPLOWO2_12_FULL_38_15]